MAALLAVLATASPALADKPAKSLDPEEAARARITGVEDPGTEPGDAGRTVGNVALWVPRNVIDYTFRGMATAAGLIADSQILPRYQDTLGTKAGDLFLFPTLFAETGTGFSVGLRIIGDSEYVATSQRVGYGGPEDVVVESRAQFKGMRSFPVAVTVEGFYQLQSEIEYHGIGLTPSSDPRNTFVHPTHRVGLYRERRVRGIASAGMRAGDSVEFYLSGSFGRRQVTDTNPEDAEGMALSEVFQRGSIVGAYDSTWLGYVEAAARFDSRASRGRPSPGVLLEGYIGGADETEGTEVTFMRTGARLSVALPIYRQTNLLQPRIVIDGVIPLGGVPIPFTELARQPDFRGFDTHRDNISIVASLDYTWQLVPFMGMRVFFDGATLSPDLGDFSVDNITNMRYAAGMGVDFFTTDSILAQLALSGSPDGVRFLFNFGVPARYGDRQHRD